MASPFVEPHVPVEHERNPRCRCSRCRPIVASRGALASNAGFVVAAVVIAAAIWMLAFSDDASAREGKAPRPIKAPPALLEAREACPVDASLTECRAALVRAYAAVRWQRNARLTVIQNPGGYGVQHAIRLAAALYGIPLRDLNRVISCESGHDPDVVNGRRVVANKRTTPFAVGLLQWLRSSWDSQGLPGFDRTDPYASVLAAGRAVVRDNGWSQWECKP